MHFVNSWLSHLSFFHTIYNISLEIWSKTVRESKDEKIKVTWESLVWYMWCHIRMECFSHLFHYFFCLFLTIDCVYLLACCLVNYNILMTSNYIFFFFLSIFGLKIKRNEYVKMCSICRCFCISLRFIELDKFKLNTYKYFKFTRNSNRFYFSFSTRKKKKKKFQHFYLKFFGVVWLLITGSLNKWV